MKLFLLAFFVVAAVANPIPNDEDSGNIDVIVNGVPEGEALNIGHIVDIKAKETVNGEIVAASDVLHPFTAVGIAEAVASAEAAAAQDTEAAPVETPVIPEPVILPEATAPIETPVIPEPVVLPEPAIPEVVEQDISIPAPVVLPESVAPVVIPEPVVLPEPVAPVVVYPVEVAEVPATPIEPATPVDVAESLPQPSLQTGEVYNNGVVSMLVNSQEPSLLSSLQNWFSMVVNYVTNGVTGTSSQIV